MGGQQFGNPGARIMFPPNPNPSEQMSAMADDTARPIPTNNFDDEPTNAVDKETNGGTGAEISKGDA